MNKLKVGQTLYSKNKSEIKEFQIAKEKHASLF